MSKRPVSFKIGWNACIQCSACIAVCPQGPEFVSPFNTIAVDTPCDIACMNCEDICPVSTIFHYDSIKNEKTETAEFTGL